MLQVQLDPHHLSCLELHWDWPFLAHFEHFPSAVVAHALALVVGVPLSAALLVYHSDYQSVIEQIYDAYLEIAPCCLAEDLISEDLEASLISVYLLNRTV